MITKTIGILFSRIGYKIRNLIRDRIKRLMTEQIGLQKRQNEMACCGEGETFLYKLSELAIAWIGLKIESLKVLGKIDA